MSPGEVQKGLTVLAKTFNKLFSETHNALSILEEAKSEVQKTFDRFKSKQQTDDLMWGYAIKPEHPLVFNNCAVRKSKLQVDVFCDVRWKAVGDLPCHQELVVRVWSLDRKVSYRTDLDANHIGEQFNSMRRRVMLRYHFELANAGQPGPRFHLQAGGNPQPDELCWLHEAISVPRIAHPPMDLILACEMIAANFFGDDSDIGAQALRDPIWLGVLRNSQANLLKPYIEGCLKAVERQESLLTHLWGR